LVAREQLPAQHAPHRIRVLRPRREEARARIAVRRVERARRFGSAVGSVARARSERCAEHERDRGGRASARYTAGPAEGFVPIRAVVFDLSAPLVDLRWERLPVTEHRGKKLPASTPALHACVRTRCDVDLDAFLDTMMQGDRAFAESHYAHDREVPTVLRMSDVLRRLGIEDKVLALELT